MRPNQLDIIPSWFVTHSRTPLNAFVCRSSSQSSSACVHRAHLCVCRPDTQFTRRGRCTVCKYFDGLGGCWLALSTPNLNRTEARKGETALPRGYLDVIHLSVDHYTDISLLSPPSLTVPLAWSGPSCACPWRTSGNDLLLCRHNNNAGPSYSSSALLKRRDQEWLSREAEQEDDSLPTGQELRTNSLAQSQSVKQLGDEEWWRRGIRDLNIDDDQWKELWLTDWMCRQWEDEDYTVSTTTTAAWTGKRPAFDLDDAGHNIMRRYATATYNIFIFIGVRTATITTYCWFLCLYNTGPA